MHFKSGPRLAGSSDVIGGAESTTNSRVSPGHRLFIMRWEENARWGHDKLAAITCAAPGWSQGLIARSRRRETSSQNFGECKHQFSSVHCGKWISSKKPLRLFRARNSKVLGKFNQTCCVRTFLDFVVVGVCTSWLWKGASLETFSWLQSYVREPQWIMASSFQSDDGNFAAMWSWGQSAEKNILTARLSLPVGVIVLGFSWNRFKRRRPVVSLTSSFKKFLSLI